MWWIDIVSIESEPLRVHLLFTPVKLSVHVARRKDYMSINKSYAVRKIHLAQL